MWIRLLVFFFMVGHVVQVSADNSPAPLSSKHISLNFQKIPLRTVLQLLADSSGVNIVVSERVEGDITVRLHDVPWEQALDVILKTHGLYKRQTNNTLIIDVREQAASKDHESEIANTEPIRADLFPINYAKAVDIVALINDKQTTLLSESGSISADPRTNSIWVQDNSTKVEEIRKFIKTIDIPVQQVQIEARIVEVSKDFTKELGIRWGVSKIGPENTIAASESQPLNKRLNLDLAASAVNFIDPASIGLALARLGDGILLDLELSALESEGRAELISSPKLITANRQSAVIESGQEIPYQETTRSGATAVAFKKAVLSLKVTPQITPDGTILMDLQINQDTPSHQTYNGVPAISTKEIQTNVLVKNGQTLVLGGIYKQDRNNTINRLPFFGKLPIFGGLFRNTQQTVVDQELLIFITPKILGSMTIQ